MSVGFIGLGIMGSLQAMNLAQAGYELTVFNRTREKADAWVAEHGGTAVDSPRAVAEACDVVITMVCGGAEADLERARPLFEVMGEKIVVCGEAGQGQAVKVISQAITAVNCATLAQGLVLARQAGVSVEKLLETMDGGSSDSTMRALKGKPMLEHDFTPLFKLAHMLKYVQPYGMFPGHGLGQGRGARPLCGKSVGLTTLLSPTFMPIAFKEWAVTV